MKGKNMSEGNALSNQYAEPMSLGAFLSEVRYYCRVIQEEEPALSRAYDAFVGGQDVWSDQCRRIVSDIKVLSKVVQRFCKLLMDVSLLPSSVVPYRYLTLTTLQHMDEQIRTLLPLLKTFRTSSKKRDKLLEQIERKIELLLEDCQESPKHVRVLTDQIRFEEKKM